MGWSRCPAAPQTVMLYLAEPGGARKRLSTIGRRLAALAQVHRAAGFASPSEASRDHFGRFWTLKGVFLKTRAAPPFLRR